MKKLICAMVFLLLFSGCQKSQSKGTPIELGATQVVERLHDQDKDTFLLYITTDECYSCEEYDKVVKNLQEIKPFDIYYLSIDLEEDSSEVKEALNELEVTIGNYSTFPMTYYFYKGNLQPENIKKGYIEEEDYEKWLKDLHIHQMKQ